MDLIFFVYVLLLLRLFIHSLGHVCVCRQEKQSVHHLVNTRNCCTSQTFCSAVMDHYFSRRLRKMRKVTFCAKQKTTSERVSARSSFWKWTVRSSTRFHLFSPFAHFVVVVKSYEFPSAKLHEASLVQYQKSCKRRMFIEREGERKHHQHQPKSSIFIRVCVRCIFDLIHTVPAHFTTKNKQISVAKGKQVHVQCNVQGDTPIDIKWKIQNTQQHLDESLDTR